MCVLIFPQPSSCLRDQEEIYDYIPPKGTIPHFLDINDQETHHTPIYSSRWLNSTSLIISINPETIHI